MIPAEHLPTSGNDEPMRLNIKANGSPSRLSHDSTIPRRRGALPALKLISVLAGELSEIVVHGCARNGSLCLEHIDNLLGSG